MALSSVQYSVCYNHLATIEISNLHSSELAHFGVTHFINSYLQVLSMSILYISIYVNFTHFYPLFVLVFACIAVINGVKAT